MDKLAIKFTVALLGEGRTMEANAFLEMYATAEKHVVDNCFPEWVRFKRTLGPFPLVYGAGLHQQYSGTKAVASAAAKAAQELWEAEQ